MEIKPKTSNTSQLLRNSSLRSLTFDLKSNKLVNHEWEASRASEIVNIRSLILEERKIRSMIREGRKKKKFEINNLHTSTMRDKYEASSNLYITETRTGKNEKEEEIQEERTNNLFANQEIREKASLPRVKLNSSKMNIFKGKSFSQTSFGPVYPRDNINLSHGKISEFMDKSRKINFLKYILEIKNDCHFKQIEDYKNEIDIYKDNINAMEKAYKKESEFIQTYNSYFKYVMIEKKKESLKLYEMERKKHKLEGELKRIENQIQKLNERQVENKILRNFIICVKERRFLSELIEWCRKYISEKFVNKTISITVTNNKKKTKSHNSFNSNVSKMDSTGFQIMNDKELLDKYFAQKYATNPTIFNNSLEIYEVIKSLEYKNLTLIQEFNKNDLIISDLNKQIQDSIVENAKIGEKDQKLLSKNEHLVADLVFKNKILKVDKEKIEKAGRNLSKDRTVQKYIKNYSAKFYSKICETYKICTITNIPNVEEILAKFNSLRKLRGNNSAFYLERAMNPCKILSKEDYMEMLALCEKIILSTKNSYAYYYSINRQELKQIEMSLEHERVKKKAEDKKKELLKKSLQLREKITQKMSKIYILPRRKVTGRYKFIEKKNKNFEKINTSENIDVYEFLNFEDN